MPPPPQQRMPRQHPRRLGPQRCSAVSTAGSASSQTRSRPQLACSAGGRTHSLTRSRPAAACMHTDAECHVAACMLAWPRLYMKYRKLCSARCTPAKAGCAPCPAAPPPLPPCDASLAVSQSLEACSALSRVRPRKAARSAGHKALTERACVGTQHGTHGKQSVRRKGVTVLVVVCGAVVGVWHSECRCDANLAACQLPACLPLSEYD